MGSARMVRLVFRKEPQYHVPKNIGHPKVNFSLSIFLLEHPSRRPLACREKERERGLVVVAAG